MTAVMTLMKTGFGTIAKGAALCCAALFILMAPGAQQMVLAQQMTLERVGPELAHPWGMDFLTSDSLLVTTRGGTLWKIGLADGAATCHRHARRLCPPPGRVAGCRRHQRSCLSLLQRHPGRAGRRRPSTAR